MPFMSFNVANNTTVKITTLKISAKVAIRINNPLYGSENITLSNITTAIFTVCSYIATYNNQNF